MAATKQDRGPESEPDADVTGLHSALQLIANQDPEKFAELRALVLKAFEAVTSKD